MNPTLLGPGPGQPPNGWDEALTSWKPKDIGGHTYSAGDVVELRDYAEKGFKIAYRVRGICTDGALQLDRVDATDGVVVSVDDIAEAVFPARPEVLALIGLRCD